MAMNQIGIIISRERKKQNMSQGALCEGICSVSYLSKIENLEINAPDETYALLVEALGYKFDRFSMETVESFNEMNEAIYEDVICFSYNNVSEKVRKIKEDFLHPDSISMFSFDVEILELIDDVVNDKLSLETVVEYRTLGNRITPSQKYILDLMYYYLIYSDESDDEEHSVENDPNGNLYLAISFIDFKKGRYRRALGLSKKAYSLFVETGNYHGMIQASSISCSSYSNLGEWQKHIDEANKIIKLNRVTNDPYTDMDIHYNIGATYLTQRNFAKAIIHLNKGYTNIHLKPSMHFYFLEKLGLAYAYSGQRSQLIKIIEQLDEFSESEALIQLLETISLNHLYLKDPKYISSIEYILNNDSFQNFGRKQMYASMLYQGYRANYKYHKCIEVLEKYDLTKHLAFES